LNRPLLLAVAVAPRLRLRAVTADDAEHLRVWKNENRHFFFHKAEILPEQQRAWLEEHLNRPDDFMFVVELSMEPVGCMGFRIVDGEADVYNVILGRRDLAGQGLMSASLRTMLRFAEGRSHRVSLKVLKDNPAVAFYERNGFRIAQDQADHYLMTCEPPTATSPPEAP
jgi:RimJ/RimL family protein N-acetyltransferase